MVLRIEYNINGIGIINANVYPLSKKLLLNEKLCIEGRLKNTNQLGSIRYIHNGAHYNRYEYVLLQMSILNVIKQNSEIGLSSNFNFKKNWGIDIIDGSHKSISGAEIMQCIFLCTNLGHFKDTFAANKVWYHFLAQDVNGIRKTFRSALSKESKKIFDCIFENEDYQKLHLLNTLFILNRNESTKTFLRIFEKFVELSMKPINQDKWVDLYSKIRKVSYTILDSHFSYIPIDIDLQNILFNQKLFIDEVLKQNSTLFAVLDRLNDLLEDTLYLENNVVLMGSYRSLEIEKRILEYLSVLFNTKTSDITKLLLDAQNSPFFETSEITNQDIPWDMEKNLSITYHILDKSKYPNDVFEMEKFARNRLGVGCFVAFNFNPSYSKYRTVFSINKNEDSSVVLKKCLKIVSYASNEYMELKDHCSELINNGKMLEVVVKKLCTYVFRNLLVEDYYCEFIYKKKLPPFIITKGSKSAAKELKNYIEKSKNLNLYDKDALHEIEALYERLSQINYKGLIIIYAGSLKLIDSKRNSKCELDGIILMPSNKNGYLNVIEAKNYGSKSKRVSEAKKQLNAMFLPLIKSELNDSFAPQDIDNYGCYINLK